MIEVVGLFKPAFVRQPRSYSDRKNEMSASLSAAERAAAPRTWYFPARIEPAAFPPWRAVVGRKYQFAVEGICW